MARRPGSEDEEEDGDEGERLRGGRGGDPFTTQFSKAPKDNGIGATGSKNPHAY